MLQEQRGDLLRHLLGRVMPVAPDAGRILLRNVYGWFERTQPGTQLG